jgi:phosphoribosylaminoimidazolecarboxamide formyltransferase/IMP cyclohydrolase
MNDVRIHRALISVSDKTGLVAFAKELQKRNVRIISTGGTLKSLREAGIEARSVSEVTGFPEILDGRVKTLHPKIHAGLLAAADNPAHAQQLRELSIESIDMVVVNLYPFEQTVARNGVSLEEAIEQIDIGGPTMLRAAAKNYRHKAVIISPSQYETVLAEMEQQGGCISAELRFELAKEAFLRTSQYDAAICGYFTARGEEEQLPKTFAASLRKAFDLRYGENPHQRAALYGEVFSYFEVLHGKELSYNNILDIQGAVELIEEFAEPTAAIIKHANPCGVGSGNTIADAYEKALATDKTSAFGGIVAVNRPLDVAAAAAINEIFTEVIIGPEFPGDVLELLKKKKDRRLVRQKKPIAGSVKHTIKTVAGGLLVQTPDELTLREEQMKVVTKRRPTQEELEAMKFAWRVAKHVKSNAIVYARQNRTLGIGAGQMSRVDSSRFAVTKARNAGLALANSVVASDGFFPFADGLLEAVNAGATAVIQPGGSVRDEEVIRAADEHNVAMILTGIRHFRH